MKNISVWQGTAEKKALDYLRGNIQADTVIIGGGIAGLLCAYRLKEQGRHAVVLEARSVGSGASGGNTGKITAQHGLCFSRLIKDFGLVAAKEYALKNNKAVEEFHSIINGLNIDCDFAWKDSAVYSLIGEKCIEEETKAANDIGLHAYTQYTSDLPFPIASMTVLKDQASFHPLKFIYRLADELEIYENSRVIRVEGTTAYTKTGSVTAKDVIFACHYPTVNIPGFYFLKLSQHKSYAVSLQSETDLCCMYVDANPNGLSFNRCGKNLIIVSEDHRTGKNKGGKYDELEELSKSYYPDSEIAYKWSAQDCKTVSGMPYVGNYSMFKKNWYVLTGFDKWGMTNSMAAANSVTEAIIKGGRAKNTFRLTPAGIPSAAKQLAEDVAQSVSGLVSGAVYSPKKDQSSLSNGEGGIVMHEGKRVGMYKDNGGGVHVIDPKCPHLGCLLSFNGDDKIWECPCHGTSLDVDGNLMYNPSVKEAQSPGSSRRINSGQL